MAAATGATEGLSVGQKVFFIGGIAVVCSLFIRTRGGKSVAGIGKEKSLA